MALESIVTWIVVGGVAGWLGQRIVKGFRSGVTGTVLVGVVGAVVGGWIVDRTGVVINLNSDLLTNIAVAVIGSVVLLLVLRASR